MKELEDLEKINWCIKMAESRINLVNQFAKWAGVLWRSKDHKHNIIILTASIKRLENRRERIIRKLFDKYCK